MSAGTVRRVAGPMVEVTGGGDAAVFELVELGPSRIPGEVVAIRDGTLVVQAYEYTGGLAPGDRVIPSGRPLSARLGPGLLGQVFDGLLRPLSTASVWLTGSAAVDAAATSWQWRPAEPAPSTVEEGGLLGGVVGAGSVPHRVLAPPGVRGAVREVRPAGPVSDRDAVAVVGGTPVTVVSQWPVRRPRPIRSRRESGVPLLTGQRVVDVLYPLARGSAAAVPGGFGTGKTVLLQQIAKWCDADVIVYVGCGERGNELADTVRELADLADPRNGGRLLDRTVVIANTSNMPMMAREASVHTAVTVAEYYRDMGHDVVVIADSTSRWAEALREFATRTGALPAEEGYPATLASALASFYERAGRVITLGGKEGSVTIVGAVSPPSGDLTEPVTANTQRFVRAVWTLDRELAYARHYPAVGWTGSFSRDAAALGSWYARHGDPGWIRRRDRVLGLLADADRLGALADLVGVAALPGYERTVLLGGRLLREAVLQQSALSPTDARSGPERSAALIDAVLAVVAGCADAVARQVPAAMVEEVDFGPLVRMREEIGDNPPGIRARADEMLTTLGGLR
ncbi:MAG TPA: V-type ATP synthase subunit A [Mycobacteriales bacterium]